MKHVLNKEKMIVAMAKRGWSFDDIYGWLAPRGFTKQQMEQQWVDSICESIECLHEHGTEDTRT